MNVNDFVEKVHTTAREKGWYDKVRSPLESHMLMVTELAEATEAVRKDYPPVYANKGDMVLTDINQVKEQGLKPEGEAVELVDAIIRIADYFGYRGWDLEQVLKLKMDYNDQRSYRHGGKKF